MDTKDTSFKSAAVIIPNPLFHFKYHHNIMLLNARKLFSTPYNIFIIFVCHFHRSLVIIIKIYNEKEIGKRNDTLGECWNKKLSRRLYIYTEMMSFAAISNLKSFFEHDCDEQHHSLLTFIRI